MITTPEEIDALEGRDLDVAVAEYVMFQAPTPTLEYAKTQIGWRYISSTGTIFILTTGELLPMLPGGELKQPEGSDYLNDHYALYVAEYLGDRIADEVAAYRLEPAHYSDGTNMNATWQVVEAMWAKGYKAASAFAVWWKGGRNWPHVDTVYAYAAPKAARAICRAALHAMLDAEKEDSHDHP